MSHAAEHGDRPAHLHAHFFTSKQQADSAKLGMWLFLAQEILFFSGLFMAYIAFRYLYPETYLAAHEHLSWKLGGLNTIFLITSSLTMALAVRGAQTSNSKFCSWMLVITILFACGFMVVKFFEYKAKISHGMLPGQYYTAHLHGYNIPGNPGTFFAIYFTMTGTHGLHVLVGIGVLIWILVGSIQGKYSAEYYSPVENVGLYWHLVDLIWIFLFPLLYLVK